MEQFTEVCPGDAARFRTRCEVESTTEEVVSEPADAQNRPAITPRPLGISQRAEEHLEKFRTEPTTEEIVEPANPFLRPERSAESKKFVAQLTDPHRRAAYAEAERRREERELKEARAAHRKQVARDEMEAFMETLPSRKRQKTSFFLDAIVRPEDTTTYHEFRRKLSERKKAELLESETTKFVKAITRPTVE